MQRSLFSAFTFSALMCMAIAEQARGETRAVVTPDVLLEHATEAAARLSHISWLGRTNRLVLNATGRLADLQPCIADASVEVSSQKLANWILLVDVGTQRCRIIGSGRKPVPSVAGDSLAVLPDRPDQTGITVFALTSGPVTPPQVFDTSGPVDVVAWAPDGRSLVFGTSAQQERAANIAADASASLRNITVYPGEGDPSPSSRSLSEVWLQPLGRKGEITPRRLATIEGSLGVAYTPGLQWFPDGTAVLAGASVRRDVGNVATALYVIHRDGRPPAQIFSDEGAQMLNEALAPDGRDIALLYDPASHFYPSRNQVATIARDGGELKILWSGDTAPRVSDLKWTPRGDLWLRAKSSAFFEVFTLSADQSGATPVRVIQQQDGQILDPALSPDDKMWAWHTRDLHGRLLLRVAPRKGLPIRTLLNFSPGIDKLSLSDSKPITWRSRDGLEVAGVLTLPLSYRPGVRYPLIVDLHGGPTGGVDPRGRLTGSPLEFQMWAAKGFAVFSPDWRGSGVYGFAELERRRQAQDGAVVDMTDIMSGIDALIERGLVDPDRMALIGHSAGAYLVNWLVTHSARFKAAVSYEGISDMFTYLGIEGMSGNAGAEWALNGLPWETPQNWVNSSPRMFVKDVSTPTLFVSGGRSVLVRDNSYLYAAWRRQGIPAQHVIYRDEGHVVSDPQTMRDLLMRAIRWIETYVK